MINEPIQCTAQNHAGHIIITKDHMLLASPRGHNAAFRSHLEKPVALNNGQIMVGEPAITQRIRQHTNVLMGLHRRHQLEGELVSFCRIDRKTMVGE